MALLIDKNSRVLLQNSEITRESPWLLELMESQPNFKKEDLGTLPKEQQMWFRDLYNLKLKQAVREWKPKDSKPCDVLPKSERIPCQLCGTPNRYIFFIVNIQNGTELNVGRECVKNFGFEFKGDMRQLIKEAKRLRNLEALAIRFDNIRMIERWDSVLDEQEILIPYDIENPYIELGKKAKIIYEEALENGVSQEIEDELNEILFKHDILISKIREYVEENKLRKFIPTRDIVRWVKRNSEASKTLDMLKEDGVIKWRTAHRIYHPGFARSLIAPFNSLLSPTGWAIQEFDDTGSRPVFVLISNQRNNVKLSCVYDQFVLEFGGTIFGESEVSISLKRLISISRLYGENSVYNALTHMSDLLFNRGFEVRGVDISFGEFIVYDSRTDRFIVCSELTSFANEYKMLVFRNDQELFSRAVDRLQKYQKYDIEQLSERQREMLRTG